MANKGTAALIVFTDIADAKNEEEFNTWYNTKHLPDLTSLPGVLDGARYVAVTGAPKYLSVYELADASVVRSSAWLNRPLTDWDRRMSPRVIGENLIRVIAEQIYPETCDDAERGMAPAVLIGRMSVPQEIEDEWNAWYNEEYIPGYLKVPGVIAARRFRVLEGGNATYTTMYELEDPAVRSTPEWSYQHEHSSAKTPTMHAAMTMDYGSPGIWRRI